MNRLPVRLFLFSSLLFCCLSTTAQSTYDNVLHRYIVEMVHQPIISQFSNSDHQLERNLPNSHLQVSEVPEVFCYESLGFFCKLEHQAMQRGNFPLRFRLGEFQQTVDAEYGREW